MSVKKYAPYRKEAKWDSKRVDRLKEFKNKISERVPVSRVGEGNDTADKSTKKRKGKKERSKLKAIAADEDRDIERKGLHPSPAKFGGLDALKRRREYQGDDDVDGNVQEMETHGKKKRRRRTKAQATEG
jgi:protein KRI1